MPGDVQRYCPHHKQKGIGTVAALPPTKIVTAETATELVSIGRFGNVG